MKMNHSLLILFIAVFFTACTASNSVDLEIENTSPQVEFAQKDLEKALLSKQYALQNQGANTIRAIIKEGCCEEGGYQIKKNAPNKIEIAASEPNGLMYGLLEVSEQINIGISLNEIQAVDETPYIKKRGIKFNIPLDIRTSAFDDSGDAAQKNITTVWDFAFWEHFFDNMARHRYNVISYWNAHPFSSMVQLEDYPDVALQDIWGTNIDPQKDPSAWKLPELPSTKAVENKKVLKKFSIKEKIAFWQKVMQHAKDRGIDIYFMTWNICLNGAAPTGSNEEAKGKVGKYGITNDYKNETSKDYLRKSVKKFLLTYPHVTGIGVTAGENMRKPMNDADKEKWLWDTYGLGIMDAKEIQKDRKVNFIHRFWWTDAEMIEKYWGDYPDQFDMSFKYAKARLYSSPTPIFHKPLLEWMKPQDLKSWWNLRNDDIFIHRWADPTYVRDFIKNMPYEATAGFQMGSDGYVWAKEFISKNPKLSGQYEIDKHWMRFMLWGRLGYNPNLSDDRFKRAITQKYPEVDADKMLNAWIAASKIIPQINTFHWRNWDFMWQPEANFDIWNDFKDINTFREVKTMEGSGILNIQEYVQAKNNMENITLKTPLDVVRNLQAQSSTARVLVDELLKETFQNDELKETLLDIKSMSALGDYYALKISGALELEHFKTTGDETFRKEAIRLIEASVGAWERYAALNIPRYKPQSMARTRTFDFSNRLPMVKKDIELIVDAKTYQEEPK